MQIQDSYFVNRNGRHIWLSCGVAPHEGDVIIEVRPMAIAGPGMVLIKDGVIIGKAVWTQTGLEGYDETEEPIEEEPEEEPTDEPAEDGEPIGEPEPSEDEQTLRIG